MHSRELAHMHCGNDAIVQVERAKVGCPCLRSNWGKRPVAGRRRQCSGGRARQCRVGSRGGSARHGGVCCSWCCSCPRPGRRPPGRRDAEAEVTAAIGEEVRVGVDVRQLLAAQEAHLRLAARAPGRQQGTVSRNSSGIFSWGIENRLQGQQHCPRNSCTCMAAFQVPQQSK